MKQMKISMIISIVLVLLAIMAVSGCTTTSPAATPTPTTAPTPAPTAAPATAALSISGMVDNPLNLSMAGLMAYTNQTITTPGRNNTTLTFTGISLNKLLDDAKLQNGTSAAKFTGSDGYSASINITDIRASPNAVIAFMSDGTLKDVVPGLEQKVWVGNLTTIQVS